MILNVLDERPIVVALAGSNGAGKTTFYHVHLADTGLRFVNADDLANELKLGPYEAAEVADTLRQSLIAKGESFVFETVFSDPVGAKIAFLHEAIREGFRVVLIFVKIPDVEVSRERVSMRAAQGGHDVPDDKIEGRFSRTLANLQRAIDTLPFVLVYDNSDMLNPFRHVASYVNGEPLDVEN